MMTGNEIREKFLEFFAGKNHTVLDSSPLVPQDDPTLLFTNAGMVQFKRLFTGEEKRDYLRAATSQRCVRAGGKHNDLENVGYTARHHTFFEMLGNFSFGDYFKEDAIRYSWEFLVGELGLPPEKLWVSVYEDDDEAFAMWEQVKDLPPGRVVRLGARDNFWAMGDTGPCGPCSEIHIDQGPEIECDNPDCAVGCDCDRYLELWNLVFMQFERSEDGSMTPLPKPSIDTGMGLERIAAVVQGGLSNYDSDLFAGLLARIAQVANLTYGENQAQDTAMRVIADHSRATSFLVADGVLPSNEGRGYVLRRIIRRAVRFGRVLQLDDLFMAKICQQVVSDMVQAYPHLGEAVDLLVKVVNNEEDRFRETLDHGLEILAGEIERLSQAREPVIGGEFVFKLYDTYGFPVDIVRDMAIEAGLTVDEAGFNQAMENQRDQSRRSWKAGSLAVLGAGVQQLMATNQTTDFVGYGQKEADSEIIALMDAKGDQATAAGVGDEVMVVTALTPFYAESGGQVGDQGEIIGPGGRGRVLDTIALAPGLSGHRTVVEKGSLAQGEQVGLRPDQFRRQAVAANHTATHILQAVLVEVLGDHVKQSGSQVEDGRLRFDFTHFSPLTENEMAKVEGRVNEEIRTNSILVAEELARDEAMSVGATALFGEKYGDVVRVVSIASLSKELCGGTHVGATGEIGMLKIISESGIAAGVRRIEAVTGGAALAMVNDGFRQLDKLAALLKTGNDEIISRVDRLLARQKELEREVGRLNARLSVADLDSVIEGSPEVKGVRVVTMEVSLDSAKTLREVGDRVRDKLGSGMAVLGGVLNGKVSLLVIVSADLKGRLHAGQIVKEVAEVVGGSGGGRPDMAQAGGSKVDQLSAALALAPQIAEREL